MDVARPKPFMRAAASALPCARQKPCYSTWQSKAACTPAASWGPSFATAGVFGGLDPRL